MPLDFTCPNGHRIVCGVEGAGRGAKCPKCGVQFRIPATSGVMAAALSGMASGVAVTAAGNPGESSLHNARMMQENTIVFLCPNGHRLNAPSRLQGQAGQCPHCGAKFLVPAMEDSERVAEVDLAEIADGEIPPLESGVEPTSSGIHPLCQLVRKLWVEKEQGGIFELHLDGGSILVPDWFEDRLSRQTHGLFASQAADGTVTMTAIAWDRVVRIVVRNVEGLPEGMFE